MATDLQKCQSARKLTENEIIEGLMDIHSSWVINENKLSKTFFVGDKKRDSFARAFKVAENIAQICEEQCHHPELIIKWGSCEVRFWTHSVGGLSDLDFELAKRIDKLSALDSWDSVLNKQPKDGNVIDEPLYPYPTSFNEARKQGRRLSVPSRGTYGHSPDPRKKTKKPIDGFGVYGAYN
jgi:4a-hydroxytetrahydrobiopterin dehydratase